MPTLLSVLMLLLLSVLMLLLLLFLLLLLCLLLRLLLLYLLGINCVHIFLHIAKTKHDGWCLDVGYSRPHLARGPT